MAIQASDYRHTEHQQFVEDMELAIATWADDWADDEQAGDPPTLTHYEGRNYWNGPAVYADSSQLQAVIRATSIQLQWDQMGRTGLVIYPKAYDYSRPI